ncbi:hypothetical protein TRM7615_04382 [Falsiruegeria mediterranea M17]|uniref:Cytochrome c domain-containing protein n=2 Tax=Falsiruegeria TaxID=2854184 RepID=A0A2R8CEJ7_9RHOB|nr:hypothetical protein TRM7615_04382 [Falsiruegeria mediterranea M17]
MVAIAVWMLPKRDPKNCLTFLLLEAVGLKKINQRCGTMKKTILISAIAAAGTLGYLLWPGPNSDQSTATRTTAQGAALVEIVLPERLTTNAQIGKRGFDANCAACHGLNAVGQQGVAPPLVHVIYEPGHHGDESFQRAVAQGVRAHHWPFGNMPPVDGLSRPDVTMITQYVRELQRANGIN